MAEKGTEQKSFEYDLEAAGDVVREKYLKLLAEARSEAVKKAHGRANISLEERRALLAKARIKGQYGNADPDKMAEDWERYNKRPPIGGAND